MNKIRFALRFYLALLVLCQINVQAQDVQMLSLDEVVALAKDKSTASLRAETNRERSYWQWRTFKSNYNPQLTLLGTLPDFSRRFETVQQDSGDFKVVPVFYDRSNVNLRLSQSVGLTGGQIFINSGLTRFSDFRRDRVEYNGSPFYIGFRQPLFNYNPLLWDKRIEPLRYEESQKEFVEDMAEVSINATSLFFDLMLAQVSMDIALNNLANNDTIYKIAEGRYNLGKIAENELLQLQLNLMNSQQAVAQAQLDLETSTLRLKSYIGIPGSDKIELLLPEDIPEFEVDEAKALQEALKNRSDAVAFKRRELEAQASVAQARGDAGINANLFGSFGLTNRATTFYDVYNRPENQQEFQIGFEIPIMDWGRTKSRVRTAEANEKLIEYTVAQDRINFEEAVFTQVRLFKMLRNQIEVAKISSEIGQKSYDISKNRFLIGKISITDLNDALEKKDDARRRYIRALSDFWDAYFNLRRLTLYDFQANSLLLKDLE